MTTNPAFIAELKKLIDDECKSEEVRPDDYTVSRLVEEKNIARERAMRILKGLADKGYCQILHGNTPGSRKRIMIFRPVEPEKKKK